MNHTSIAMVALPFIASNATARIRYSCNDTYNNRPSTTRGPFYPMYMTVQMIPTLNFGNLFVVRSVQVIINIPHITLKAAEIDIGNLYV